MSVGKFRMGDHSSDRRKRLKLRFTQGQRYRLSPLDGDELLEIATHWVEHENHKGKFHCGRDRARGCPLCPAVGAPDERIAFWVFLYTLDDGHNGDEFAPITEPRLRGSVRLWDFGIGRPKDGTTGKYDDLRLVEAAAKSSLKLSFGQIDIGIECANQQWQTLKMTGLGAAVWQRPEHRERIQAYFDSVRMTDDEVRNHFGQPTPMISPMVPQSLNRSSGPHPQIVDGEALEDQKQLPAPDDEIPF